jgi:hypothetical protein
MKEGMYIGMRLSVIRKSIAFFCLCCVLRFSCLLESGMENRGISGLILHC